MGYSATKTSDLLALNRSKLLVFLVFPTRFQSGFAQNCNHGRHGHCHTPISQCQPAACVFTTDSRSSSPDWYIWALAVHRNQNHSIHVWIFDRKRKEPPQGRERERREREIEKEQRSHLDTKIEKEGKRSKGDWRSSFWVSPLVLLNLGCRKGLNTDCSVEKLLDKAMGGRWMRRRQRLQDRTGPKMKKKGRTWKHLIKP